MRWIGSTLEFETTGRKLDCNAAVVGLSNRGEVAEGYDGWLINEDGTMYWDDEDFPHPIEDAEREELAQYMQEQWRKWGAQEE